MLAQCANIQDAPTVQCNLFIQNNLFINLCNLFIHLHMTGLFLCCFVLFCLKNIEFLPNNIYNLLICVCDLNYMFTIIMTVKFASLPSPCRMCPGN